MLTIYGFLENSYTTVLKIYFSRKAEPMLRIIFTILVMLVSISFASAQIKSVYTKLDDKHCRSLKPDKKDDEIGRLRCGGVSGYWIRVTSYPDDALAELVTPSGMEYDTVSTFAGHKIASGTSEWRVNNGQPIGLIVRYSVQEPEGFRSYLVVSKISRTRPCVIGTIPPGKTQNAEARKLADSSASKPCNKNP